MNPSLDVVIAVLNEERDLPPAVHTLHRFLERHFSEYRWGIVIADNGSSDSTEEVSRELSAQYPNVRYLHLEQRGRGRALRTAWLASDADFLAYMDVDLSTNLEALPKLIDALRLEGCDIAIGSRLAKGAKVIGRSPKREVISRCYNFFIQAMFFVTFKDAQCGFKALTRRAARELTPIVEDNSWFFDTELLLLAVSNGYRLKEVPVEWTDDPDSRVKIVKTATDDFKGLLRLRFGGLKRSRPKVVDARAQSAVTTHQQRR